MLEDILLLENVGPIILCLLAGPFSDRWDCLITSFDTLADLRRYSSLNLFCAQVWPETTTFTLLLGNESDLCWIWNSCYHRSHTQVSHSFKVLATLSISLRLPSFYYMLPSLGISLGGQFFVFFQVFLIGCCDSGQNLWESADKSFPINVRCSLPTQATTQTASKKAIESLQGGTLCNLQNSRILCK